MAGYRAALDAAGLDYDEALAPRVEWYGRADGEVAMKSLLDNADVAERPDAVFCFADVLAEGAMHATRKAGLRIPEDIAFVGFDDLDEAKYASPPLTTVAPNKQELARLAVAALMERIEADVLPAAPAPGPAVIQHAGHRLVIRESSGAVH